MIKKWTGFSDVYTYSSLENDTAACLEKEGAKAKKRYRQAIGANVRLIDIATTLGFGFHGFILNHDDSSDGNWS